jgi:ribosomal protein L37AE/L43A
MKPKYRKRYCSECNRALIEREDIIWPLCAKCREIKDRELEKHEQKYRHIAEPVNGG